MPWSCKIDYLTFLRYTTLKLKWVQFLSSTKGIVCCVIRFILQMFSWEARKSKETHWSNLKHKSRHCSEVNTGCVIYVGFFASTERRFPLNIRLWWFGSSNPFPKNESHSWAEITWRSNVTQTNVKHNLAILIPSWNTTTGYRELIWMLSNCLNINHSHHFILIAKFMLMSQMILVIWVSSESVYPDTNESYFFF